MDVNMYWNPVLETLPREKLRALQFKKFKRVVEWAIIIPRCTGRCMTRPALNRKI